MKRKINLSKAGYIYQLTFIVTITLTFSLASELKKPTEIDPELLNKIKQKQQEREESFTKLRKQNILDDNAKQIIKLSTEQLLTKLQSGELTAKEVLRAYTAKALEVTDKFNSITEFIPNATDWATALDNLPSNSTHPLPLHGLPFAVKDDFNIEGMDSTLGYARNLYKPANNTAVLVKILIKMGAIPFCKTNVPQTLLSSGSHNPIFGSTLNSVNPKMVTGGSSTGSASLVAAGGAVFATGSDIGGSLRGPSHFHGLSTLKATLHRLSGRGVVQCTPDNTAFEGKPGIIAATAKTLSLVWKAITEHSLQNKYDYSTVPIPWNEELFGSKETIKIGYFTSIPFFPAFPDTVETLLTAKTFLESKGHQLIPFQPFGIFDSFEYQRIFFNLYLSEGELLRKNLEGEPPSNSSAPLSHRLRIIESKENDFERNLTAREKYRSYGGHDIKTAGDLSFYLNLKKAFVKDVLLRMEEAGIDLIISPAYPFAAVSTELGSGVLAGGIYKNIWNFCNFPAGSVKFGEETATKLDSYDDQGDELLKTAKLALRDSAGMPISVQVISTPFKEELVLRFLVELENEYQRSRRS